jgi:hypothetical protein
LRNQSQKKPSDAPSTPPSPLLLPSYLSHPTSSHRTLPLPDDYGGERSHIHFRLSKLKERKMELGNYTKKPDQYTHSCREVSQIFKLSWEDVMLLLSQIPLLRRNNEY